MFSLPVCRTVSEKANTVTKEQSSEASNLRGAIMKSCTHKRLLATRERGIKEGEEALPLRGAEACVS